MVPLRETIQIKSNSRVLICSFLKGKYEYKYLGKINPEKKIFFTFRPLNHNNQSKQIISLPFSLIKKLSDERYTILIHIPGKSYNISASEFLLNAQLDNRITEYREIRMSLPLSEFNTGSIKTASQSNNIKKYSNKLKNAKAV